MPIKMSCPECDKEYNLADTMEGKTVKCKGCGKPFTVESTDDASTAVAVRPTNGKVKRTATAAKPSVKKRVADDDDEDEDDEEEAPKKGGMGKWLLIGGGLVAVMMLLACGGVGIGGFLWWKSNSSPETASTTTTDKTKENTDKDKTKPPDNTPAPPATAKKFTLADYQQVKGGMTIAQVEAILGLPFAKIPTGGDNKIIVSTWASITGSVNVRYYDGKVQTWSAVFDGKAYPLNTDPTVGPGPNPMSTSQITFDNFNKIKIGMNQGDLFGILGQPTKADAKPDPQAVQVIGDRGSSQVWTNGADSITVSYTPDFKAAYCTANIGGQTQTKSDPLAVKPAPNSVAISKDNYNRIMGGEFEQQIKDLLKGANLNANTGATDQVTVTYDKPHVDTWSDPQHGVITVTFCNGRAAHWTGLIDGMPMEAKTNQAFVVLKGANPNPPPNASKLTKAAYNTIVENQTPLGAVAQAWGPPMSQGNNGKNPAKDAGYRTKWIWVEGNSSVDVEVNIQGIITHKGERGLK